MKIAEKIEYLQENHLAKWVEVHGDVEYETSTRQAMICVCGRLATGMHERGCKRFKDLVNKKTVERLKDLIKITK